MRSNYVQSFPFHKHSNIFRASNERFDVNFVKKFFSSFCKDSIRSLNGSLDSIIDFSRWFNNSFSYSEKLWAIFANRLKEVSCTFERIVHKFVFIEIPYIWRAVTKEWKKFWTISWQFSLHLLYWDMFWLKLKIMDQKVVRYFSGMTFATNLDVWVCREIF